MLNKTVCKACCNGRAEKQVYKNADGGLSSVTWRGWGKGDEMGWKAGDVFCRFMPTCGAVTNEPPPDWCEYKMEHLVSRKKK